MNTPGCYPGCFYYTDSCFRTDCKRKENPVTPQEHDALKQALEAARPSWVGSRYVDSNGRIVGHVGWVNSGIAGAWYEGVKLGEYISDDAARAAVERRHARPKDYGMMNSDNPWGAGTYFMRRFGGIGGLG